MATRYFLAEDGDKNVVLMSIIAGDVSEERIKFLQDEYPELIFREVDEKHYAKAAEDIDPTAYDQRIKKLKKGKAAK
jgi:hypothetical protein